MMVRSNFCNRSHTINNEEEQQNQQQQSNQQPGAAQGGPAAHNPLVLPFRAGQPVVLDARNMEHDYVVNNNVQPANQMAEELREAREIADRETARANEERNRADETERALEEAERALEEERNASAAKIAALEAKLAESEARAQKK